MKAVSQEKPPLLFFVPKNTQIKTMNYDRLDLES